MANGNAKKSFLDLFKITDSSNDDFDDDMFDEEDNMDDYDEPYDDSYDDTGFEDSYGDSYGDSESYDDGYDDAPRADREKSSPLKSFNKYKNSRTTTGSSSRPKSSRSTQNGNGKLVSINGRADRASYDDSEVFVIKPDEFDDAQMIIDHLNRGQIIVINMEDLDLPTAQRIADFIGGASYAVNGLFQAISGNIFLATPNGTYVSGDLREELAGGSIGGEDLSSKATY